MPRSCAPRQPPRRRHPRCQSAVAPRRSVRNPRRPPHGVPFSDLDGAGHCLRMDSIPSPRFAVCRLGVLERAGHLRWGIMGNRSIAFLALAALGLAAAMPRGARAVDFCCVCNSCPRGSSICMTVNVQQFDTAPDSSAADAVAQCPSVCGRLGCSASDEQPGACVIPSAACAFGPPAPAPATSRPVAVALGALLLLCGALLVQRQRRA